MPPIWPVPVAAVFYFCAPVAGITGSSSSYNDAAGVFFPAQAFYLLLLADLATRYPLGLSPDSATPSTARALRRLGAVLFVAAQRRWKPILMVAAGAAVMMAPWMVCAVVLTGNPWRR